MSFKSWQSYWNYSNAINTKNRYILDDESKEFLNNLLETSESRIRNITKGSILWRAQNGHSWEPIHHGDELVDQIPCPFPPERMKPLKESASEGRANPKGIPCLYVATTKETAMAEIRPWLGAIVSVGQFKVGRDLKIVDFSVEHGNNNFNLYFKEPTDEEKLKAVWCDIDNAFSEPIQVSDSKSEYAPTQIIGEFMKNKGYDGVAYKSSLSDGHNIALFDLDSAKLLNCSAYETKKVQFQFDQICNTYFIRDKS